MTVLKTVGGRNKWVILGAARHIGSREEQQDCFGFSDFRNRELFSNAGILAVLADGMGGMDFGKEAGECAVSTLIEVFSNKSPDESVMQVLHRAATIANSKILEISRTAGDGKRAGTTLASVVVSSAWLYWLSAGDSRIYLLRNGELLQLTADHTYERELEKLVRAGRMTEEELFNHPEKDCLISFLGVRHLERINVNPEPFLMKHDDIILLCSDGLYRTLSDEEIGWILRRYGRNPRYAARQLISRTTVKKEEYQDNITVVVLKYNG